MPDLLVLCPTRGRPAAAREALQSFLDTKALGSSELLFVVDDDDPQLDEYLKLDGSPVFHQPPPGNMVRALNGAALWAAEHTDAHILGFVGDDHRFRTPGWDRAFADTLAARGGGFVYGNDTIWTQGEIPTQIFMSTEIVRALGWMGLPTCDHLYIDNVWRVLGEETNSLYYMPDVVIEHLHPAAGKVAWDEGHRRVNTVEMYSHDGSAFAEWVKTAAAKDVARVKEALGR